MLQSILTIWSNLHKFVLGQRGCIVQIIKDVLRVKYNDIQDFVMWFSYSDK